MKQTLLSATLDNGIVLLGEELPDLESVAVAFHAPAGGIHDGEGRCGLASLTSEMMLRGAGDRDSRQLVEDLAMAGINWSNAVSTTHATYFGAMVAKRLPEAVSIYADILRRPQLPADQFESGRQVVLQDLAGTDDDPSHRTLLALKKLVFPAPWGLPSEGLTADVEQLTPEVVEAFASTHVRPDGMIVAAAGRLDWPDFVKRMEAAFADWEPGTPVTVGQGERGGRWQHVEHDSQQTHIAIAWSAPPTAATSRMRPQPRFRCSVEAPAPASSRRCVNVAASATPCRLATTPSGILRQRSATPAPAATVLSRRSM